MVRVIREEVITIPQDEYEHLLRLRQFISNWYRTPIWACPKCGTYNPEGYICINCSYDNSTGKFRIQ